MGLRGLGAGRGAVALRRQGAPRAAPPVRAAALALLLGLCLPWRPPARAFGGAASARARPRGAPLRAAGPVDLVAEVFREEAQRCWGAEGGGAPGYIGDYTPPGLEYDQLSRSYAKTEAKPQPRDPRPWRKVAEGEQAPPTPPQERDKDVAAAMAFFKGEGAPGGGTLLDIGCGDCFVSRQMVRSGQFERIFALDVDWTMLEVARAAAERERLGPEDGLYLMRADAQELPFEPDSVDFAWWGMGYHKVQDGGASLAAICKALKPRGRFLATTVFTPARFADIEQKARDAGFGDVVVEKQETAIVIRATK